VRVEEATEQKDVWYFECVTFKDIAEETIIQAQSGALSALVLVITAVVVRG
jgi:hypothetical protein